LVAARRGGHPAPPVREMLNLSYLIAGIIVSKLCASLGIGKAGLNSGLKQKPSTPLGQASYRVGE